MKNFGNRQAISGKAVVLLAAMAVVTTCPAAEPSDIPSLEKLPKVQRLWLGMEEGLIRPAAYEQLLSDVDQWVQIHVAHGAELKKGQHWATLAPRILGFERRSHALDIIRGERDLAKELATLEDERIKKLVAQQEAMANLQALKLVSKDGSLPVELRRRSEVAADKLRRKIELMDKELEPEAIEEERELIRKDAALRKERRDKQLEDLERRSIILANCDGTLVLSDLVEEALREAGKDDVEGDDVIWIKGGEPIGVVRNDDHHELWVNAQGPLLADLPLERVAVRIQDPRTGGLLAASHIRTQEIENGPEIKRTYVFRIDEQDVDKASKSIGVRSMVHVYVTFDKSYRMVFKKDIAHLDPVRLEKAGWAGLVHHLWPGSKVVQVGPQTIAIQAPNEN